jgi:hypothetical protein
MRFACLITKSIDPCSDYVIIFILPRQQWLHKRVSLLGLQMQCLSCEVYHYPLCWCRLQLFLRNYLFFNIVFLDIGHIAKGRTRSQNQRQYSVLHDVIYHVLEHVLAVFSRSHIFLTPGEPGILICVWSSWFQTADAAHLNFYGRPLCADSS